MKNNFTAAQINWASQHDWFVAGNSEFITASTEVIKDGKIIDIETIKATSFKQLREWAGY